MSSLDLENILMFDGKFNETIVKGFYSNMLKNIAQKGNPFQ